MTLDLGRLIRGTTVRIDPHNLQCSQNAFALPQKRHDFERFPFPTTRSTCAAVKAGNALPLLAWKGVMCCRFCTPRRMSPCPFAGEGQNGSRISP